MKQNKSDIANYIYIEKYIIFFLVQRILTKKYLLDYMFFLLLNLHQVKDYQNIIVKFGEKTDATEKQFILKRIHFTN